MNIWLSPSFPSTYSQITSGRKNRMICSQSTFIFSLKINRFGSGQELLGTGSKRETLFLRR